MVRAHEISDLLDGRKVILYFNSTSEDALKEASYLIEEGVTMPLITNWSARFDKGLQPNQQDHLHVMKHGRDITIINKDGSPSHGTSLRDLPKRVADRVRRLNLVYMEESRTLIETASSALKIDIEELVRIFYMKAQQGH